MSENRDISDSQDILREDKSPIRPETQSNDDHVVDAEILINEHENTSDSSSYGEEENENVEVTTEVVASPRPAMPAMEEWREHAKTHVPYKARCSICVQN